jgi:hypothetical protein
MADPTHLFALAAIGILAVAIAAAAALRGWQGWLELKRLELGGGVESRRRSVPQRIEMADLRDRVRRLESIANGTDS